MNGSAPNCSATGSHVDVVRKLRPNFCVASEAPRASCQPIRNTSTTTVNAMARVSHSNALSANGDGLDIRSETEVSGIDIGAAKDMAMKKRQAPTSKFQGRSNNQSLRTTR